MREKIVNHMKEKPYMDRKNRIFTYGEFFPIELSPFAYNETVAQELRPLNQEEISNLGYNFIENTEKIHKVDIGYQDLPDNINEVEKNIIGMVISCEHDGICNDKCTKAFKITDSELAFYKNYKIPLPRLCPNCRHYNRFRQKNPLKLWHRICMCDNASHNHSEKCKIEFETSYAPEKPEIVYCETCYQKEVY